MKIIYSGGGTLGPVTPLLAMHKSIRDAYPEAEFLWVGTKRGPERALVEEAGIQFITLSSGKFRRYISIWNIVDLFRIMVGFFQSLKLVLKERPDLCISGGGFISVPLHWAAWFYGTKTWVHQQDVRVGLANRLMVPCASIITTALESSTKHFPKRKVHWLGNPVRQDMFSGSKESAVERFGLRTDLPVIFATGGGTGSQQVNQMIVEAAQHLEGRVQIIHLSGKERPQELVERASQHIANYQVHQFFTVEMADAYAAADIVVSRGGFGTLTEIAMLGKCAVLIPKPGQQVENVAFLEQAHAAILIKEQTSDGLVLANILKELLADPSRRDALGHALQEVMPVADPEHIKEITTQLTKKNR